MFQHDGVYYFNPTVCRFPHGSDFTDSLTTEPPTVVTPLTDLECYVTETLIISAEVSGQPSPEAHWVAKPFL